MQGAYWTRAAGAGAALGKHIQFAQPFKGRAATDCGSTCTPYQQTGRPTAIPIPRMHSPRSPAPAHATRCLLPGHGTGIDREQRSPRAALQSWPRWPARCGP